MRYRNGRNSEHEEVNSWIEIELNGKWYKIKEGEESLIITGEESLTIRPNVSNEIEIQ